ncbi:MAG: hypothetical protein ACRD0G_16700 [Acidimicrobiales bacterium]
MIAVVSEDSMEQTWQPVLGNVFAPVEVLTVPARLELAALVTVPGRAPAILSSQLVTLPLPAESDVLTAVGEAILAGLGPSAIAVLHDRRLDSVVPLLSSCDGDPVARFLPVRLRGLVARHTIGVPVVELTVGEVADCPGIGPHGVTTVVAAAVAAALEVVGDTADARAGPTLEDVVMVLAHDAARSGVMRCVLAETVASGPPHVRVAAARMLSMAEPGADRLSALDRVLAAAGDVRDRAVFEHVVLGPRPSMARRDVAAALGVGLERLRQLGVRAIERVDAAADHGPVEVRELATTVAGLVGWAAPGAAVDESLVSLGLPALPDSRSRLLLRMAGPYHHVDGHPGWVALEPAELLVQTRRLIHEDGGVRAREDVARELHLLGMAGGHVADWLARQPVRVSDGLVVATTGTPGDVAERALHACGRAMTVDELAVWVPGSRESVEALWSARDRRFVVTDSDALALAEWPDVAEATGGVNGREPPACTLRVAVDDGVLGGAAGPVPSSLAHTLGLRRGSRRSFPTRYGPVAVPMTATRRLAVRSARSPWPSARRPVTS